MVMKHFLILLFTASLIISCKKTPPELSNMEKMEGQWKHTYRIRVGYYDGHQMSTMTYSEFENHLYTQGKITRDGQEIGSYTESTVTYYEHDTTFQIILVQQDSAIVIDQCPDGLYQGQEITGTSIRRKLFK